MALTMGSAFGFSGVDWGASLIDRNWAKRDAADQAQANERGAERAMAFSSAEALANRTFQETQRETGYQTVMEDMRLAGLNPMLAFHQGSAHPTGGGQGTGFASQGAPTRGTHLSGLQGISTAAQIDNIQADTEVKHAQRDNIAAQTKTEAIRPDVLRQEIQESVQRITESTARIPTYGATAENLQASAAKLRAELPQIEATINNLKALTHQAYTHSGLFASMDEETRQRVRANLPDLTAKIQTLEERFRQLQLPQRGMDAAAHSSFLGALGAVGRALNPFLQMAPSSSFWNK